MKRHLTLAEFFLRTSIQATSYGLSFLLPNLIKDIGGDERDVGLALLSAALATLVAAYYSGQATDLIGRMRVMALAGFFLAIGLLAFGTFTALSWHLWVGSFIWGLGWGFSYTLAPVVLAQIVHPAARMQMFALLSVFVTAGFGLSPVCATVLLSQSLTMPQVFQIVAIMCALTGLLNYLLVRPVSRLTLGEDGARRSKLSGRMIVLILRSPGVVPITMVFLGACVFAGLINFQTVFTEKNGLDHAKFFFIYTVTVMLCRIVLAGFFGGRSPYATNAALQAIMCASVILFIFVDGEPWI